MENVVKELDRTKAEKACLTIKILDLKALLGRTVTELDYLKIEHAREVQHYEQELMYARALMGSKHLKTEAPEAEGASYERVELLEHEDEGIEEETRNARRVAIKKNNSTRRFLWEQVDAMREQQTVKQEGEYFDGKPKDDFLSYFGPMCHTCVLH